MGENVRGLQDRVREEADGGVVRALLGGFVFELGHPACFTKSGHRVEDPRQLAVSGNMGLDEQCRCVRVNTAGNVLSCGFSSVFREFGRVLVNSEGVEIHHTKTQLGGCFAS